MQAVAVEKKSLKNGNNFPSSWARHEEEMSRTRVKWVKSHRKTFLKSQLNECECIKYITTQCYAIMDMWWRFILWMIFFLIFYSRLKVSFRFHDLMDSQCAVVITRMRRSMKMKILIFVEKTFPISISTERWIKSEYPHAEWTHHSISRFI